MPSLEPTNEKDAARVEQPSSSLILYNGTYINIEQLLLRLDQSEESRRETENQFKLAQSQLGKNDYFSFNYKFIYSNLKFHLAICRMDLNKSTESVASLCRQLEVEKQQVESTSEELVRLQVIFLNLLLFGTSISYFDFMHSSRIISTNMPRV